jgi:hypothetical protein
MQTICKGQHGAPAVVDFLPCIDLKPTDESCIFSTLLYVERQAKYLNITDPCITFDQPLYLKAMEVSKAEKLHIVCRLGGFHLLMSFLGSIGSMMAGSGLAELLQVLFGSDTVSHMLSGKAYTRSIRGHFLVESALMTKLLQHLMPVEDNGLDDRLKENQFRLSCDDALEIGSLVKETWTKCLVKDEECNLNWETLWHVEDRLEELKKQLIEGSRTARLWLQYLRYISVVKEFIAAERTGNWQIHLKAVSDMLGLFAATGHNSYAKCARLYLQSMMDLPKTHPWLHEMFAVHGFHAVRRSDRFWSGLSTDLVIEQTLMGSIKGQGGLTRGRGFSESARSMWISTLHNSASVHFAMLSLTGLTNEENSKHADTGASRTARDYSDIEKLLEWLDANNPFEANSSVLRGLSTGLIASEEDNVNCDCAEDVGLAIQVKMDGKLFYELSLKKSDQIKSLEQLQKNKNKLKPTSGTDLTSLFQRLLVVVERSADIPSYFAFELTSIPLSLFNDSGFMRKPNKPALAKALLKNVKTVSMPPDVRYVVDGGALLHRVRWLKNSTYLDVVQQYILYVKKEYCGNTVIVFDGYTDEASVKDHEHKRRAERVCAVSPNIAVDESRPVLFDQQAFLANSNNKQQFIQLLMQHLCDNEVSVMQSCGDADADIVSRAPKECVTHQQAVAVVADDTDIMIMLIYHFKSDMPDIFFVSEAKKRKIITQPEPVNIRAVQDKLGLNVCKLLLLIHAMGGCDTTSAVYGMGKAKVLKRMRSYRERNSFSQTMCDVNANQADVASSSLKFIVHLYGGKSEKTLAELRYASYCKMVSTSTSRPQPQKLPPSERSAYFHALRVHFQVVVGIHSEQAT